MQSHCADLLGVAARRDGTSGEAGVSLFAVRADVLICGRKQPQALPAAGGREATFVARDVRDVEGIDRCVSATTDRFGRFYVLASNAGGSSDAADDQKRWIAPMVPPPKRSTPCRSACRV